MKEGRHIEWVNEEENNVRPRTLPLSLHVHVNLPAWLFQTLSDSVCPSVCLSLSLSVSPSLSVCPPLSVCLSICLSLPLCLSICPSPWYYHNLSISLAPLPGPLVYDQRIHVTVMRCKVLLKNISVPVWLFGTFFHTNFALKTVHTYIKIIPIRIGSRESFKFPENLYSSPHFISDMSRY